jgi:hypothetical protein
MRQETNYHSDYEPRDHRIDAGTILSSFVMLLVCLISMVIAH